MADGRLRCSCGVRVSPTAGTIFDKTRTPLTVWFMACWLFASQKDGISALALKRSLEIGSYQTAWAMLHRLRSVLVRPAASGCQARSRSMRHSSAARSPGSGAGARRVRRCWSAWRWNASSPRASGAAGWVPIADASAETLRSFLLENVEPGATVITDGWPSYPPATKDLYIHKPIPGAAGADASTLLPGVHKVSSLAKHWLLGTHQGSVDEEHLAAYLNEFVFRFNRRRSRSRGLVFYRVLELAAAHDPVRYRDLIANPEPGRQRRPPPATRGRPPSLERPAANRPWRIKAA